MRVPPLGLPRLCLIFWVNQGRGSPLRWAGLAQGLLILPPNVRANAFSAGFHLVAHGARPPLGLELGKAFPDGDLGRGGVEGPEVLGEPIPALTRPVMYREQRTGVGRSC